MMERGIRRKVEKEVRRIGTRSLGLTLTEELRMIGAREGDRVEVVVDEEGVIRIRRVGR